jgi:glutamine amidotransferase
MCRWVAYSGSPIVLEDIIRKPARSLVHQSLHAVEGTEPTNGDGFGVGWYGNGEEPGLYRSTSPAWNDSNLRELSAHIESGLFLAHIRASTGSPVQQTNCHPFRYGRWLWMHNGSIRAFKSMKRELVLAIDPTLYPSVGGSTDSEVMFFLALTLGLESDPPGAVARMVALVEEVSQPHGIEHPIQMTLATSDGERLWAFRYSSEGRSRTLYYSTDVRTLRKLYPDNPRLASVSDETRLVVSEPLADLPGAWNEVPESSYCVVQPGDDEIHDFQPNGGSRR